MYTNTGAPIIAVTAPTGKFIPLTTILASISETTSSNAPQSPEAGNRKRISAPIKRFNNCGHIIPTKPITPTKDTQTAVISEDNIKASIRNIQRDAQRRGYFVAAIDGVEFPSKQEEYDEGRDYACRHNGYFLIGRARKVAETPINRRAQYLVGSEILSQSSQRGKQTRSRNAQKNYGHRREVFEFRYADHSQNGSEGKNERDNCYHVRVIDV